MDLKNLKLILLEKFLNIDAYGVPGTIEYHWIDDSDSNEELKGLVLGLAVLSFDRHPNGSEKQLLSIAAWMRKELAESQGKYWAAVLNPTTTPNTVNYLFEKGSYCHFAMNSIEFQVFKPFKP